MTEASWQTKPSATPSHKQHSQHACPKLKVPPLKQRLVTNYLSKFAHAAEPIHFDDDLYQALKHCWPSTVCTCSSFSTHQILKIFLHSLLLILLFFSCCQTYHCCITLCHSEWDHAVAQSAVSKSLSPTRCFARQSPVFSEPRKIEPSNPLSTFQVDNSCPSLWFATLAALLFRAPRRPVYQNTSYCLCWFSFLLLFLTSSWILALASLSYQQCHAISFSVNHHLSCPLYCGSLLKPHSPLRSFSSQGGPEKPISLKVAVHVCTKGRVHQVIVQKKERFSCRRRASKKD